MIHLSPTSHWSHFFPSIMLDVHRQVHWKFAHLPMASSWSACSAISFNNDLIFVITRLLVLSEADATFKAALDPGESELIYSGLSLANENIPGGFPSLATCTRSRYDHGLRIVHNGNISYSLITHTRLSSDGLTIYIVLKGVTGISFVISFQFFDFETYITKTGPSDHPCDPLRQTTSMA